jgi:hypothetical protein
VEPATSTMILLVLGTTTLMKSPRRSMPIGGGIDLATGGGRRAVRSGMEGRSFGRVSGVPRDEKKRGGGGGGSDG